MAKKSDEQIERAKELYKQGMKLVDIAVEIGRPEGTIRRWKSAYGWNENEANEKSERSRKKANVHFGENCKEKEELLEEFSLAAEDDELTDKQRLFCVLYVRCFNATKAYQKAYDCDYKTAMVNGSRMLRNAKIKEIIISLKKNRMDRELFSEEDIFQKYMDIAFADITDFVGIQDGAAIVFDSNQIDGTIVNEVKMGKFGASLKLNDRMRALKWLSEHMEQEKEEQEKPTNPMVGLTTEELKKLINDG